MSNQRFEMYQYRQIIVRLRLGESLRGIGRSGLADRKTARRVRDIAVTQGWLDSQHELPDDAVLEQFLGTPRSKINIYENSKISLITYLILLIRLSCQSLMH